MANNGMVTGFLREQPEVRYGQSGKPWCEFVLQVPVKVRGEWVEKSIPFKTFGDTAAKLEQAPIPAQAAVLYRVDLDEWEYKGKAYSKVQLLCYELLLLLEADQGAEGAQESFGI